MVGHTSIVYSVDAHASGFIVSDSEDRFAKIWKDGVCVQSLEHLGCVWDAKFLDNGDIVTACSDGVVRIWSAHQDKIADPLELESYAAQLSQYMLSRLVKWLTVLMMACHALFLMESNIIMCLMLILEMVNLFSNCPAFAQIIHMTLLTSGYSKRIWLFLTVNKLWSSFFKILVRNSLLRIHHSMTPTPAVAFIHLVNFQSQLEPNELTRLILQPVK